MHTRDRSHPDAATAPAEMREDRDRWRAQAERLASALDRLKDAPPAQSPPPSERRGDDLLYGMPAIASAFGWRTRQAEHLKESHGLPTFKVGKTVCANRPDIAAWIAARGADALAAAQGGR